MSLPMFPKPGQMKKKPEPIKVFSDGREKVNLNTAEGRAIYLGRKKIMYLRQDKRCCLFGKFTDGFTGCAGQLRDGRISFDMSMFEHEEGRTGGKIDDRIEKMVNGKMKWINGVACPFCNSHKGSRKIYYNEAP
jgi:hypothetical protein